MVVVRVQEVIVFAVWIGRLESVEVVHLVVHIEARAVSKQGGVRVVREGHVFGQVRGGGCRDKLQILQEYRRRNVMTCFAH